MINVALIGLGKIGYKYDLKKKNTITHFKSINNNKSLNLKIIIDKNNDLIDSSIYHHNYKIIKLYKEIDIVVVSTPTKTHLKILKYLITKTKVKLFIIEKPFCNNLKEFNMIMSALNNKKKSIIVNYMRLFDKSTQTIKKKVLISGKNFFYGYCSCYTNIESSAVHVLSMLFFLFGKYTKVEFIDKNIFKVFFKQSYILFNIEKNSLKKMPSFELNIYMSNGKLYYENEGHDIFWSEIKKSSIYNDEYIYSNKRKKIENDLRNHGANFYDKVLKIFKNESYKLNTVKYAKWVHEVMEFIKQ